MKYLLLTLMVICQQFNYAQSVTPHVLASGGISGKVNNIQFDFVLGELATTTITNRDTITQGFLQPSYNLSTSLPVTGLQFTAKRISNTQVQLNWKTQQEFSNKGFYIERKKEDDYNFRTVGFIPTAASGGNSILPLQYQQTDDNSSSGKTLYRLKQEDIDGRSSYSLMQVVQGTVNKNVSASVWPVPSKGPVYMIAAGIENNSRLQVYDVHGRIIKELTINNNTQIRIDGLVPGTYVLKLVGNQELSRKIIVQ